VPVRRPDQPQPVCQHVHRGGEVRGVFMTSP
jgi:hypothetical protein